MADIRNNVKEVFKSEISKALRRVIKTKTSPDFKSLRERVTSKVECSHDEIDWMEDVFMDKLYEQAGEELSDEDYSVFLENVSY